MQWLPRVRHLVDRVPLLGRSFRDIRDHLHRRNARFAKTPWGFELVGSAFMASGAHEATEIALVHNLLDQVDVVLDVGANVGLFTCMGCVAGKQVFAFEPHPDNLHFLYRNVEHNALSVEIFPVALSSAAGLAKLYGRLQGASLVVRWGNQPEFDYVLVPVNTLDALVAPRTVGKRVLLKLDVEGAELGVLRGASKILAGKPIVLFENSLTRNVPGGFNSEYRDVFEVFWTAGYEVQEIPGRAPVGSDDVSSWIAGRASQAPSENFLALPPWTRHAV